jgi:hypothetical protein
MYIVRFGGECCTEKYALYNFVPTVLQDRLFEYVRIDLVLKKIFLAIPPM